MDTIPNPNLNPDPSETSAEEREPFPFVEATRKIMLAAIGAMALGRDELEDFLNKLVERGEIAEKDGRKLMGELMEKRKKTMHGAEEQANKHMEDLLDRMNVPSKKDIDELSAKVALLSKKIDELTKPKSK
jgi:poly(hydroxyalkanoate) granule-associated protein